MMPIPKQEDDQTPEGKVQGICGDIRLGGNGVENNRDDARHLVWIPAGAVKAWGDENITLILFKLGVQKLRIRCSRQGSLKRFLQTRDSGRIKHLASLIHKGWIVWERGSQESAVWLERRHTQVGNGRRSDHNLANVKQIIDCED